MNALLARREQLGLRFSLYFNLVMMVFFTAITVSAAQSTFEVKVTFGFIAIGAVAAVLLLRENYRGRLINTSGWILTALYIVIDWGLPWIWYHSLGGDAVPRTYFLKVGILPVNFIFLVITCLAGRPIYPLVFTLGSSLSLVALAASALSDPRTVLSATILDSIQGRGANLPLTILTDVMYLVAGALLTIFVRRVRQTVIDASQAEHATAQLGRYFSPEVAKHIASSDETFLHPGGTIQQVAVLFSDIRGFTTLSESLRPETVLRVLSLYQEQMVAAIFEHGGTLDKFIGDGIMATFGTPRPAPDDARRAVAAGLSMLDRLDKLNVRLRSENLPELKIGIGIHAGPAIVGNIGTSARLEYTVIGDTVNTASRLESACKETGDPLLVSRDVAEQLTVSVEPRGEVVLRGKKTLIALFAVPRKQE